MNNDEIGAIYATYVSESIEVSETKPTSKVKEKPFKKPRTKNPIPFYKRLQIHKDYQVAVDALNFAPDDNIRQFFLSHFHADHYIGICKSWSKGTIFASETTINLINLKFKTDRKRLIGLKLNTTYHVRQEHLRVKNHDTGEALSATAAAFKKSIASFIDLTGSQFSNETTVIADNYETDNSGYFVTLIDANHCPGAVIFLFESVVNEPKEKHDDELSIPSQDEIWKLVNKNSQANDKHSAYRRFLKSCENFGYSIHRILHTGDFRASGAMLKNPILGNAKIDKIYLDTTYLNPLYCFPAQKRVVSGFVEFIKTMIIEDRFSEIIDSLKNKGMTEGKKMKYQQRITQFIKDKHPLKGDNNNLIIDLTKSLCKKKHLICVGSYTIGKEKLVIEIATLLKVKIYCNPTKRKIFECFSTDDFAREIKSMITDDPYSTNLHIVGMRELQDLERYFKPFANTFRNIVGIRPTGWSYNRITSGNSYINGEKINSTKTKKDTKEDDKIRRQQIITHLISEFWETSKLFNVTKSFAGQFKNDKVSQIYELPYSEHSSFAELCIFLILVDCKHVIPTVNLHNLESIREMKSWIEACESLRDSWFGNVLVSDEF